jgi:hypothetical protein
MGPYCETSEMKNMKQEKSTLISNFNLENSVISLDSLNLSELSKRNSFRPSLNSYMKNKKDDEYCRQSSDLQVIFFFFFLINFFEVYLICFIF